MTTASPIDRTANMNEQSLPADSHQAATEEIIQEDYADDEFNEDEQPQKEA